MDNVFETSEYEKSDGYIIHLMPSFKTYQCSLVFMSGRQNEKTAFNYSFVQIQYLDDFRREEKKV